MSELQSSFDRQQKLYDVILDKSDNSQLSDLMLDALKKHFIDMYTDPTNVEFVSLVNESIEKDNISFETVMEIAAKNLSTNASLVHVTEAMAMAYLSRGVPINEEMFTHKFSNTLTKESLGIDVNVIFSCSHSYADQKLNS